MSDSPPSGPEKGFSLVRFWQELKRRNVVRVALVYSIVGWLVIQVANATFSSFGIPVWAYRFVVLMVLLGFPLSLIIAWAFELTPGGITRSKPAPLDNEDNGSPTQQRKRKWLAYGFAAAMPTVIFGSLAIFFYFQSGRNENPTTAIVDNSAPSTQAASIAVLPLINMSHQEENEYFAGGVHEDILTNLSRIKTLSVVSRTTMLRYAASDQTISQIGEALDVDYIVEGSVRRIGKHVRVTIQLNHAREDRHLWANNFEREVIDEFATQSELAKVISSSLHLEIQPETVGQLSNLPTTSVKAYDLYLNALNLEKTTAQSPKQLMDIRNLLAGAVEEDPDFVEAWGFLKRICDFLINQTYAQSAQTQEEFAEIVPDMDAFRRELEDQSAIALAKAMALKPDNPETLLARAVNHKWPQPESSLSEQRRLFAQILAAHPEHAKTWYHLGWWYLKKAEPDNENAFAAFEKALQHDPFNARMVRSVLNRYRQEGNQDAVTRLSQRLNHILPETAEDRYLARIQIPIFRYFRAMRESPDEALVEEFESLVEARRGAWQGEVFLEIALADLAFMKNDKEGMLSILDRLTIRELIDFESEWGTFARMGLILNAFLILVDDNRTEEVETLSRQLVQLKEDPPLFEYASSYSLGKMVFFLAFHLTGDQESADEMLEVMDDAKGFRRTALSYVDLESVVEEELKALKEWKGKNYENRGFGYCDDRAFNFLVSRRLLTHPDIMAFYVEDGKWIPFLSKRLPEYAQYAKNAGTNDF
ncbi:MAG: hypothetical protein AB3N64_03180 [Puniceicoccaceae bacterium]